MKKEFITDEEIARNRCDNCVKSKDVHMNAFTGMPVCFREGAIGSEPICMNFQPAEEEPHG